MKKFPVHSTGNFYFKNKNSLYDYHRNLDPYPVGDYREDYFVSRIYMYHKLQESLP